MSTRYDGENKPVGEYIVRYMVKKSGTVLERGFFTAKQAQVFVNRINHGKRCVVLSCPSERS